MNEVNDVEAESGLDFELFGLDDALEYSDKILCMLRGDKTGPERGVALIAALVDFACSGIVAARATHGLTNEQKSALVRAITAATADE